MENNSWIEYKISIRNRLKEFALKILELSETLPKSTRSNVINYQVTKSGTSTYANYRASLRGRSKRSFLANYQLQLKKQTKLKCGSI